MTILAALSLLVWLYLIAFRGGFWRLKPDMLPATGTSPTPLPAVVAVVPARDEATMVAQTIPALLAQDYPGPFRVILVDDDSRDDTAAVAQEAAGSRADRLTVLRGRPLPAGWTGKLWAMHQGAEHANRSGAPPHLILFTDADILYEPDVLTRLVATHRSSGVVLTSLMVKLRAESAAERLLVPAFVYFFRMLYPFAQVRDPLDTCAAAAGGSMLVERAALEKAGSLAAIRGALIDDCALGRALKSVGPVWLGLTGSVRSIRPYPVFGDIRAMVARSAYAELRYSPMRLAAAIAGLALVFGVPLVAALFAEGIGRIFGLLAWALMVLSFSPMVRFYRVGWWTAPALPLIAAAYAFFTLDSAVQHGRGRGGVWKGRAQAGMEEAA